MRIETEHLPEFGVAVNWAMCRNAMCPNFGIPFEGYIPKGRKRTSGDRCQIRVTPGAHGRPVGETRCRYCGQSSRLASNKAVRPIARYFLSLSLPFADCPNAECQNHGVNLYETWDEDARVRPYRRTGEQSARCNRCETETASSIVLGTARKAANHPKTQQRWRGIIDALRAGRSIADTTESLGLSNTAYHRHLARIGARLGDYHAFRNARLLHPDIANSAQPVSLYTGVMAVGPRRNRWLPPSGPLPVIVTVASVSGAAYVLAAHPCFLPRANCPDTATLEADGGLPAFEAEWDSLRPPDEDDSDPSPFGTVDRLFTKPNPDGCRIRLPYAALAHFLVVQKVLSRFGVIHHYLDAADGSFPAALVAYRDRILAGRPYTPDPVPHSVGPTGTAEVVLVSYDHRVRRPNAGPSEPPSATPRRKFPDDAWWAAEKRIAEQPIPTRLSKAGLGRGHPEVRAALFRQALKGACSKAGAWAWLHHPPDSLAYRNPRTLWLTRMPHKTFVRHGRDLLAQATLQPLDSVFNEIRVRVRSARRPTGDTTGVRTTSRPSELLNELAVYLLRRNYGLGTRPPRRVPAEAMGLASPDEDKPDPPDIAWRFRLGIDEAEQISRWRRSLPSAEQTT